MNIVTCALPYANGNLHIGHFYEATLADIKARYLRQSNPTLFISGADCHGAATTLYCHQHNLDIETHLESQHKKHKESYDYLKISFDNFSKTNSLLHKKVVGWAIENIQDYEKANHVNIFNTKDVLSWYDSSSEQFLPDRYVKGICPHCQAINQPPEVCETCSTPIIAETLLSPFSVLTKKSVELKKTKHLILNCHNFYQEVVSQSHLLHTSIKAKILDKNLENKIDLDISRDSPYYGIKVEGFPDLDNQYFYVWLDAPIGYLTFAFEHSGLEPTKDNFNQFLSGLNLEHFIGKDIAYFHTFLWLNLLKIISDNKARVTQLNLHGWVTLNQEKFSKSKGHSFDLSKLDSQQIDALRFYFFTKSDGSISDTEYSEEEVINSYNSIVTNGLANFYARTTKLIEKNNITLTLNEVKIEDKYKILLDISNYKKLSELIQSDLALLNSQFQELELWKSNDKDRIKNTCEKWLNEWQGIYQVLCWVCPQLAQHNVINTKFTHLATKLKDISLFG